MDPPHPPPSTPPPPPKLPPSSGSSEGLDDIMRTNGSAEGVAAAAEARKSKPRGLTDAKYRDDMSAACLSLIQKMMAKKYAKRGHYFPLNSSKVICILKNVKMMFLRDPPLVKIKFPVVVVGDLHGQYPDLVRIFEMFAEGDKPGYLNSRYVFLGDYVDRGRQSLEIVVVLFMLKYLFPKEFMLLRGNHECRAINKAYGFAAEIRERFLDPRMALDLFEMFNDAFSHMPVACVIGGAILCMHGGISSKITSRDDIMKVPKPLKDVSTNEIATDLLWADPMIGLTGEIKNTVRGVSVYFGEDVLDNLLKSLDLKMVIRGHQMMMNGFNIFHNRVITVFSAAAYYPDKPNRGAVVTIDERGRIGFRVLIPIRSDDPDEKPKLFRGEHDIASDHDDGHIKCSPAKKLQEESSGDEKANKKTK